MMCEQSKVRPGKVGSRHRRDIATVDRRTVPARRHAALCSDFLSQVGPSPHSEATLALVRRAAALTMVLDAADAAMLGGAPLDDAAYCRAANTLSRTLQRLGLPAQAEED